MMKYGMFVIILCTNIFHSVSCADNLAPLLRSRVSLAESPSLEDAVTARESTHHWPAAEKTRINIGAAGPARAAPPPGDRCQGLWMAAASTQRR